jgi:hypothetical protein
MPSVTEFRQRIMIAASSIGQSKFRMRGFLIRDFLDEIGENDTAVDIGARLLMQFCVDNGKCNNFMPGLKLALLFLEYFLRKPSTMDGALRDLKAILDSDPSESVISQWIASYYQS